MVFIAAMIYPPTAPHLNHKSPILSVNMLLIIGAGIGMFRMKKWGLYLFLFGFGLGAAYNMVAVGSMDIGNSWIGLVAVIALATLNWRELA